MPKACQPVAEQHSSLNSKGDKFRFNSSCFFFPPTSFTHLSSSLLLQEGRQAAGAYPSMQWATIQAPAKHSCCTGCKYPSVYGLQRNQRDGGNHLRALEAIVPPQHWCYRSLCCSSFCSHHQLIMTFPGRSTSMTNKQRLTFVFLGVLIISTTVKALRSTLGCATWVCRVWPRD